MLQLLDSLTKCLDPFKYDAAMRGLIACGVEHASLLLDFACHGIINADPKRLTTLEFYLVRYLAKTRKQKLYSASWTGSSVIITHEPRPEPMWQNVAFCDENGALVYSNPEAAALLGQITAALEIHNS